MAGTFIVFADRIVGAAGEPIFHLGTEVKQSSDLVTIERTYDAEEPQPEGGTKLARVLSIQEDGSIGWRPKGTNGPFELAQKVRGFYLFGPGVRFHGDLRLPVYAIARFEGFTL